MHWNSAGGWTVLRFKSWALTQCRTGNCNLWLGMVIFGHGVFLFITGSALTAYILAVLIAASGLTNIALGLRLRRDYYREAMRVLGDDY